MLAYLIHKLNQQSVQHRWTVLVHGEIELFEVSVDLREKLSVYLKAVVRVNFSLEVYSYMIACSVRATMGLA